MFASRRSALGARSARTQTRCLASKPNKVVFLGTPDVAAKTLEMLLDAASRPESTYEVAAIVTQPPRAKGRGKKVQPSSVQALAEARGVPADRILCPEKASESAFLDQLEGLAPDLCITVAYGNFLPKRFLAIPRRGTLNVHPSLLPRWRGAAPVPRAIEAGDDVVGVSLVYTVLKMDAGPILAQHSEPLRSDERAPDLLERMMVKGMGMLLDRLPGVLAGEITEKDARPQGEEQVTHAAKMGREDGVLHWHLPAKVVHDKVRAFVGWPGTTGTLILTNGDMSDPEEVEVKVLSSEVVPGHTGTPAAPGMWEVCLEKKAIVVPCGQDGLRVTEVQLPGKKPYPAQTFVNGLRGANKRAFVRRMD